ncbi:hypothetical protein P0136_02230 [Lentisphaerota bacterium ZTH]|nr:hypothetical protein JYG24_06630 [Lentisphaerota bacterium]WET06824.1 hypothetical protein P0136_02230 [Lentisphaerota bacterium ZTH]
MVFLNDKVKINSVDYEVNYNPVQKSAAVTPVIAAECYAATLLAGSLELDNHELLPSFKMLFKLGNNRLRLRSFIIMNPLLTAASSEDNANLYRVTFKIYMDARVILRNEQHLAIFQ